MRKLFLKFLINAIAVAATAQIIPGISYGNDFRNLLIIAAVLGFVNLFIKPIVMLLALPVEIATLGLFTIVINAGMLLLVSYLVPAFKIESFFFPGFHYGPVLIDGFFLPRPGTAAAGALLISFIAGILNWLTK